MLSQPRHLAPSAKAATHVTPAKSRHLATVTSTAKPAKTSKPRNPIKALLGSAALLVAVVTLALTGAGSTYALWNGTTAVSASTVSSGTTGLTVNGAAVYTIPSLGLATLSPGQSVFVPVTLANTGTITLNTTINSVTITADTNSLSSELTLSATQSSSCTTASGTGTRLATFNTVAAPITMQAGATAAVCLEIKMDVDAPVSVSGGSTTFTLNLAAIQVRGA